jgi:asparagine synthase (glutamine-hydrolysing)
MFEVYSDPHDTHQSFYKRLATLLSVRGPAKLYDALKNRFRKGSITLEDEWIRLHCGYTAHDGGFFDPSFINNLKGYTAKEGYIEPFSKNSTASVLDKCLYHDLCVYLPSLLHLEDRASMAVSIESRVPLLDYRILEYLATVPPDKKVRDLRPKYLLRAAASEVLPQSVLERRDKRPFPVPARFWQEKRVREMVGEILLSQESLKRGIASPRVLRESCKYTGSPPWQLLNLELWFKIFIDRQSGWSDVEKSVK